jgi:SAM-dependent methyltransferase
MQNPLADIVSSQYQKWMYPEPIIDLELWIKNNWQWFDPSHAHSMFWPDRNKKADLDILIAGCGTNQAAVFAFNNPQAKVVAIDVSQPSLNHHQFLKDKYGMNNLELHLLPIEQASELNGEFDLIVSTGVLHHLNDPQKGIDALAQCLRREGVMALMLYAKYGRIGVEMLQSVARDLGLEQNEQSLKIVREMLSALSPKHPIKSYLDIAPDLGFDAGLVDTFLHGRDRSYSIQDCQHLVQSAGLSFQDLFLKSPYYPPAQHDNTFFNSVAALSEDQQWSVMERINANNACHFFTACRQDRPIESYHINFDSQTVEHFVPELRLVSIQPAPTATITQCANQRKDALVKNGKLDKSWSPIKQESIEYIDGKKGKEWKVTFTNPSASDQNKKNLFMFFTAPGNFIAANYTGQ